MDRIIDKLKKLLALAERGEQGEANNARLLHDMIPAFVEKHSLFDRTPQERPDDDRKIDWGEQKRILAISSTMENVIFRKQLIK